MKKLFCIILSFTILSLTFFTMGCKEKTIKPNYPSTQGLLYELSKDGSYYIVSGYQGEDAIVNIGTHYNSLPVKAIKANAFKDNLVVTEINTSSYITKIGNSAFSYCHNLTEVYIGKNVVEIGYQAFYFCPNLADIIFEVKTGWSLIKDSTFGVTEVSPLPSNELKDSKNTAIYFKGTEVTYYKAVRE